MDIKFWGTRGSYPRIGESDNAKFPSQHTLCVEVKVDQQSWIIDAGTGFKHAANHHFLNRPNEKLRLLLTHFHWDHLMGLVSIYDLIARGLKIEIYSAFGGAKKAIDQIFSEPFCPLPYRLTQDAFRYLPLIEKENFESISVAPISVPHIGETYGFWISNGKKSILHASDFAVSSADKYDFALCQAVDLLICDSFFTRADRERLGPLGHSSSVEAAGFAQKIGAKKLALIHYSPKYNDQNIEQLWGEAKSSASPGCELFLATDGLELTV